jgi:hypothetical protein
MILNTISPVYYPNWIGNRQVFVGTGNGPTSYNSTTGDILSVSFVPFNIDAPANGVVPTLSGNYIVVAKPIALGKAGGWTLFWYAFSTTGGTPSWVPVANATNLSAEQIQMSVFGGP